MAVGIVIQARMGSSRLPGKVLRPLNGIPMLGHVVGRLAGLAHLPAVVVATSRERADDAVARYAAELSAECFRGSEHDVLARYFECASKFSFSDVVRLTADNPFTDIEELGRLIDMHGAHGNDYSHSVGLLPVGVGAEIFSRTALERSHREGRLPHHREHVNEYILENPGLFKTERLAGIPAAKVRPDLRLTVDTDEDYRRACFIAEHARGAWIETEEAIALCSRFA